MQSLGLRQLSGTSQNGLLCERVQGKTKGQQLKRKIVSYFFTLFRAFWHFLIIFPPGLSPSKQRVLAQGEHKRRKDNKKNWTNRFCTLVVARLSSSKECPKRTQETKTTASCTSVVATPLHPKTIEAGHTIAAKLITILFCSNFVGGARISDLNYRHCYCFPFSGLHIIVLPFILHKYLV